VEVARRFAVLLRSVFQLERLPPPPSIAPPRRRRLDLRALVGPEPLPFDAAVPSARRERPGVLRMLLAPEPLPLDPEPRRRRRGRWLEWLFAPEKLD